MKVHFAAFLTALLLVGASAAYGTTYFVDSVAGNDASPGTSRRTPWKTLEKINAGHFVPGDRILLRKGSRWEGQLVLKSSGSPGKPIVIDWYGSGPLPRIDGNGTVENVLELINVEQLEARHLEITNNGPQPGIRRGVLVAAINFGTAHHLRISDLYIHDVNGTNQRKETGGILFRTVGDKKPSRFDDLVIEQNIVWKVDRSAIVAQSSQFARSRWFPSLHVIIRDNFVEDIGGDGIVPWATDGAVIEHNIVLHCNRRAGSYNAGIWPWSTDNSLFQLNEAAYTHTTRDGEGFDSDYNSRNSHFFYNYSHDNEGGFMLICSPGKRNPAENVGNLGTVIEYNISRNDHSRIFNLSGADQTTIQHNAIYVGAQDDVQLLLVSNWDGWSHGADLSDNTFDVAGTGRFGHGVLRRPDGTYEIAEGWGGATEIRAQGNKYFGNNLNLPTDKTATIDERYHTSALDWNEPIFDPAHPRDFPSFIARHRQWMLHLFANQFGESPHIDESQLAASE